MSMRWPLAGFLALKQRGPTSRERGRSCPVRVVELPATPNFHRFDLLGSGHRHVAGGSPGSHGHRGLLSRAGPSCPKAEKDA